MIRSSLTFATLLFATSLAACSARTATVGEHQEIRIGRSGDGHFYADASVNGKDIRFMIDTGASEIVLTPEDARTAGIAFDPEQGRALGDGASGIVVGQKVVLKSISLGAFAKTDTEVAVVSGAKVSLLGQSFLAEVDEIVIHRDEMLLRSR